MRILTLAALALGLVNTLSAAIIIEVSNSGVAAPGSLTIASNGPLAVSWTTPAQGFGDVLIQAAIGFHTDTGGSSSISAFLTTSLGAGTTQGANEVAATGTIVAQNVAANGVAAPLFTLFSGLTLAPSTTYYLSVFHVSGGTSSWDFSPFQTASDVGATTDNLFQRSGLPLAPYLPASAFVPQTFGEGFFAVTGNAVNDVPEPSTVALIALGLIGVAVRRRRV